MKPGIPGFLIYECFDTDFGRKVPTFQQAQVLVNGLVWKTGHYFLVPPGLNPGIMLPTRSGIHSLRSARNSNTPFAVAREDSGLWL